MVAWNAIFFGGSATGAGGGGAEGPGGAPGGFPPPTLDIIIVPLNFDAAVFGLSGVAQATHCVAVSVFGLPQFGQKTVTDSSWQRPRWPPLGIAEVAR